MRNRVKEMDKRLEELEKTLERTLEGMGIQAPKEEEGTRIGRMQKMVQMIAQAVPEEAPESCTACCHSGKEDMERGRYTRRCWHDGERRGHVVGAPVPAEFPNWIFERPAWCPMGKAE